jgi:hypothetical protein
VDVVWDMAVVKEGLLNGRGVRHGRVGGENGAGRLAVRFGQGLLVDNGSGPLIVRWPGLDWPASLVAGLGRAITWLGRAIAGLGCYI